MGFQKYGDNSESSCFSINDFLNWMIGIPNNDPPSRLESCILKNSNKMNINENNTITLSTPTTQQKQQQNGNNNTTTINEEIAIGIRNVSSVDADLSSSPSPVTVIPNNPITSKALKILKCYYDAFNDHNIPEAVGYLASDIKVTFPDAKKNWSSAAAAYDRYTTMFRKSPHLKGKFSLLDVTQQKTKTIITVYCHFTCIPSGVNTVREMAYIIENDIIQIINNKY